MMTLPFLEPYNYGFLRSIVTNLVRKKERKKSWNRLEVLLQNFAKPYYIGTIKFLTMPIWVFRCEQTFGLYDALFSYEVKYKMGYPIKYS